MLRIAFFMSVILLLTGFTTDKSPAGMEFVFVKGGCFQMGDWTGGGINSEIPVHEVCLDDFYIGKYEVTQGEWMNMMGDNPSLYKKSDSYPVENVTPVDVQRFMNKVNENNKTAYRLPTEAEWEYACRSGGKMEKYCGSNSPSEPKWQQESGVATRPVGKSQPNGLGIFDMGGNVAEWVQDGYSADFYSRSPRNNPIETRQQNDDYGQVIRGFSYAGNVHIIEGETKDLMFDQNGSFLPLGFKVRCDKVDADVFENTGQLKEVASDLVILEGDEEVMHKRIGITRKESLEARRSVIQKHDIVSWKGLTFHLSSWGPAAVEFSLRIRNLFTGKSINLSGQEGQELEMTDGFKLIVTSYTENDRTFGPAIRLQIVTPDGKRQNPIVVWQNFPDFDEKRGGQFIVTLLEIKEKSVAYLTVYTQRKDAARSTYRSVGTRSYKSGDVGFRVAYSAIE